MALKAVVEPMLRRPRRNMMRATRRMARMGMRYLVLTCQGIRITASQ